MRYEWPPCVFCTVPIRVKDIIVEALRAWSWQNRLTMRLGGSAKVSVVLHPQNTDVRSACHPTTNNSSSFLSASRTTLVGYHVCRCIYNALHFITHSNIEESREDSCLLHVLNQDPQNALPINTDIRFFTALIFWRHGRTRSSAVDHACRSQQSLDTRTIILKDGEALG